MIIANMQTTHHKAWMPRLSAFGVGLLLAGSGVFWVLRWPASASAPALPVADSAEEMPAADAPAMARLLGAAATASDTATAPAAPDASSRFRLMGVVALGAGKGVALLSIDGQAARPYRVGSQLEAGWVLQSVQARSVALGPDASGPVGLRLELPGRQP